MIIIGTNLTLLFFWFIGDEVVQFESSILIIYLIVVSTLMALLVTLVFIESITRPIKFLWQAVLHIKPGSENSPAPNIASIKIGREMVTSLSREIYDLATTYEGPKTIKNDSPVNIEKSLLDEMPLPMIGIDKNQKITFANDHALDYLGVKLSEIINHDMYDLLDLTFPSDNTYDRWLEDCRRAGVATTETWEHVRLNRPGSVGLKQFDMAVSYKSNSSSGTETMIALFDRSEAYGKDDEQISFVAIAVHELRNPVTLLRGYIDVFEEELSGKLDAEMADFMLKMQVSAGQLSAFINNILNVSRVENERLIIELSEQNWPEIIQAAIDGISLRAKVHHKTIEFTAPKELPTVGVDRVSIYEAVSNLLDNAIKYSGEGNNKIIVKTGLTKDGLIETTVQDFGVGIASNVLPKLFEKFYRNHRTQATVGGTGLGLYLSKAIIDAHGGNIWVNSKEGEGTTFGFTLLPYVMVANKIKSENSGITRNAHGWIKNHSLYRR